MFSPRNLDLKSLALHALVVQKIERDPVLFERVKATIARWRSDTNCAKKPYLGPWHKLVEAGMSEALKMAVEDSERGQVMRSASPFAGILTEEERLDFLNSWVQQRSPGPQPDPL